MEQLKEYIKNLYTMLENLIGALAFDFLFWLP